MTLAKVPADLRERFEFQEWRHATAILQNDFPSEWEDILAMLRAFSLPKAELMEGGGSKSQIAKRLDGALAKRGWIEKDFETMVVVDKNPLKSPTHAVDCFKNRIALEVEWNNKDPFFDRDLNNFRLLFDLRAISVGVIVTRSDELQALFKELGIGTSYGMSTTHMSKLLPRIEGGGGGGCPILAVGIRRKVYVEG